MKARGPCSHEARGPCSHEPDMRREGREIMSCECSKLELRVLGITGPARGEGPGAVES